MQININTRCVHCGATISDAARYCPACGFAQPTAAAELTAGQTTALPVIDPPEIPREMALVATRPSPAVLLSLAATVLTILALTLPVLLIRSVFFGPDDAVRNYYLALAARDANGAWNYVLSDGMTRSAYPTLGSRALRDPGYTPPSKVRISAVTTDGDHATANVAYEINGTAYRETVTLKRLGGTQHTLLRWHVEHALRSLPGSAGQGVALTVAGTHGNAGEVLVFPGQYVVGLADDPLLEAEPVTVVAGASSAQPATLTPRLRTSVGQQIDQQVRQYLDGCAAKTEIAPAGCPFEYSSYAQVTSIAWRITRYPTLQYRIVQGGVVQISSDYGTAQATGRTTSTYSPTFTDNETFAVAGTATVQGGNVVFTPGR